MPDKPKPEDAATQVATPYVNGDRKVTSWLFPALLAATLIVLVYLAGTVNQCKADQSAHEIKSASTNSAQDVRIDAMQQDIRDMKAMLATLSAHQGLQVVPAREGEKKGGE